MRSSLRILPFLLASTLANSQDETSSLAGRSETRPYTLSTAHILGRIPDGTPPPPAPPKPEYHIPARDVLATTTHAQGGRTITVQQIKPIALPPPPPPPVATTSAEVDAEFSQRLADFREEHSKSRLLIVGATVFRSKDSPPRTLVRYWPEGGRENITFWSSADFALIAGGINSFLDSAGDTHHLLMGWGNVDIDRMSDLHTSKGLEYDAPNMPVFPAGKATFQIIGNQPAEELVAIQSLHDIYNSELARLQTAYESRERARIQRNADLLANPPRPKDITLSHWRIGSATLATPANGGEK